MQVSKSQTIHVEEATLELLEKLRNKVYEETGEWKHYDHLIFNLLKPKKGKTK
jgi:hypothetical protein